ncbi:MAG: hypothetical protein Q9N68_03565 [Gammaproteobacteria bacterium]|nr:hypothetical protein [Gammaproteobacteria bacterium]
MKIYFHKVRPVQALDGLRAATASKGMDIRRTDAVGAKRLLHLCNKQPMAVYLVNTANS